ncbi:MAG TPA: hypothetical protein VLZ74_10455 [Methylocella sp.]|nr:hypothetical protein [Methylocella sp.]
MATAPLLSLLRNGELAAFAWYPSQVIPRLKVPAAYWQSIDIADFKKIQIQPGKKSRKGTYPIWVESLFDTYLEALFGAIGPATSTDRRDEMLRADLRAVVNCFDETREVSLAESDWTGFLVAKGYVESEEQSPGKRGRPEKSWSDLVPYLVAEIVGPDTKIKAKSKKIVENILQAADAAGIQNLPAESTLSDRIDVIYRTLTALGIK